MSARRSGQVTIEFTRLARFLPLLSFPIFFLCLAASGGQTIAPATSPEQLAEAGHWKRAWVLVERRLQTNPNDTGALLLASKIKESFGDLRESARFASRAVTLEEHNAEYHAQLARAYALLAENATLLKQVNYVRLLRRELDASYRLDPKQLDARLVEMMYTFKAPRIVGGDRGRSHAIARELLQIDPGWGYLAEAKLAGEENDEAVAERSLRKAVEADPSSYRVHAELGRFYIARASRPRPELARREAETALKLDSGQSAAYEILAQVYAYLRQWRELDAVLAEDRRNVPDDPGAFYWAAAALIRTGQDFDRAASYLHGYLTQEPEGRQPTHADARRLLAKVSRSS